MPNIDGDTHTRSVGCLASSALSLLFCALPCVLFASIEGGRSYASHITNRTQKRLASPSDPRRCCDRGTTAYQACFTYSGCGPPFDTCRANPCQEHISTKSGTRLTGSGYTDHRDLRVGGAVRAWMGESHLG